MRDLRTIRIFLAVIFFAAAVAYLFIGRDVNPMAQVSIRSQILPTALLMTLGATIIWLVATFVFGRIYCSTVCPIGTWQDTGLRVRRLVNKRRSRNGEPAPFAPFSYRHRWKYRHVALIGYIVCLILSLLPIAALVEPWRIMQSASMAVNPESIEPKLLLSVGNVALGATIGIISLIAIWVWGLFHGRRFCTHICPIGMVLEGLADKAVYHIEIDPDKCTNCMRCEDVCRSESIKVVSRYVDNGRCVKCFDCLKVCEDDAIRYQRNRNRRATPLLRRMKTSR